MSTNNIITAKQLNQTLPTKDWPRFDHVVKQDMVLQCGIYINTDLSYLAGHFPQQPVVPGVVQVHWVGELARQFFPCNGFASLKKIKFSNVILPDMSLDMVLDYRSDNANCRFEYRDDQQSYSSGVIVFAIDNSAKQVNERFV